MINEILEITDPGGHQRKIKFLGDEVVLGTVMDDPSQLRDGNLPEAAVKIFKKKNAQGGAAYWIQSLIPEINLNVGDLKTQSIEFDPHLTVKVGDTLIKRATVTNPEISHGMSHLSVPSSIQPWMTQSALGFELLSKLKKASATSLSIYFEGETGTGKELLAKMTHAWSNRSSGSFVPINCGALPASLAESELFGHVKGSFTGAIKDRPGALLQAHGGTLFLDEVGDLPPELQVKLLRFLENGEIRPVGSDRVLFANVRIVCATHKPLSKMVKEGKFREDLYFRLASIPLKVPSLRERMEDIEFLAEKFAVFHQKQITSDAMRFLKGYAWPGNVRELRHAVERAAGMAGFNVEIIHESDFHFLVERAVEEPQLPDMVLPGIFKIHDMEKALLLRALKVTRGNRTEAAKLMGVARSTLFEMLKRHKIAGPKANDFWLAELQ